MNIFNILLLLVPVFISVAFITLLERKVLSIVGSRVGPNKVSFLGVLQPIGDALKLSGNQFVSLSNFSFFFFFLSSLMILLSSCYLWTCYHSSSPPCHWVFPLLLFILVLGVNSLNSVLSGWSSFSKFSLIGSIRTVSQLVSYESVLYFCLFFFVLCVFGFSYDSEPSFNMWLLFPVSFLAWLPSFLAELNRTPYDFSEGESELVSGFNTEFGSNAFTLIFLGEYANILFFCSLSSYLYFYGAFSPFFFFFCLFVLWSRCVFPRYRFDNLMILAWNFLIPFLTIYFMFCGCLSF